MPLPALLRTALLTLCAAAFAARAAEAPKLPTDLPGLVAFWDFQEPAGQPRVAKGPTPFKLKEATGPIARAEGGVFGPYAAQIKRGQWLEISRPEIGALNLHGPAAQVTVVAWLKRDALGTGQCEAIAGAWNETRAKRQYCLFLNLRIYKSADQVCGHVSSVGGPTPGQKWCMDASIGKSAVPAKEWVCVAFTYDGKVARSYLNGALDAREKHNPYPYEGGLFDGGADGSDFTVAAVHRSGEMGNFFAGTLGGLAVYNRALSDAELAELARHTAKPAAK